MKIVNHGDLEVYQRAFAAATTIFGLSKGFPREEQYSLTGQIRRSSRAVCANLAEAWRRRRYEQAFINRLSIAEGEAAELGAYLESTGGCPLGAVCGTISTPMKAMQLYRRIDQIRPSKWRRGER